LSYNLSQIAFLALDKKEHNNKIDDEIIAEILRSKFLVADFTCEKEKVRGGVYFEAGFAMGLGIPVIWTVAKESLDDVHFDTRQYNHIVWDKPETLRNLLKARIGAVIGDGPLKARG
jgi:nucleoside 2-deoxyribosyltransferase